MFNCSRYDN